MSRRTPARLLIAATALALAACGTGTPEADSPASAAGQTSPLRVAAPASFPIALGLTKLNNAQIADQASTPDQLRSELSSGRVDVAALPTESAAALHNAGIKLVQLAVIDMDLLRVIGPEGGSLESAQTLEVPFRGEVADQIMRTVISHKKLDIELRYHNSLPEISTGLAAGRFPYGILPEHLATVAVTAASKQGRTVAPVGSVRDEWLAATGTSSMPGTAIVMRAELAEKNPEIVTTLAQSVRESIEAGSRGEQNTITAAATRVKLDPQLGSRVAAGLKARVQTGSDARTATTAYLHALIAGNADIAGGRVPDAGYFAG